MYQVVPSRELGNRLPFYLGGAHYFGGNRIRWEVIPLLARFIPEVKDSLVGTCILLLVTDPIVPLAVLFKCHGSVNPHPQHINVEAFGLFQVVYRNPDMINALEIDLAHFGLFFFEWNLVGG